MKENAPKKIAVFGRMNITNYGDPLLSECCKHMIEKVAKELNIDVNVTLADIYEKDINVLTRIADENDIIVYSGGGMNSIKVNKLFLSIMKLAQQKKVTPVFFNAIGLLREKPNPINQQLLSKIFDKKYVPQVTTRGCFNELKQLVNKSKKYECLWIFDPGMWANETYKIENKVSDIIGIGVIRPEIFEENKNKFSEKDVFNMYKNIVHELESRNYKWRLFTNGMKKDYNFGLELLKELKLDPDIYFGKNIESTTELVETISSFKAVIAARMHANIVATSLNVPQVGLVWNDKMNLFGKIANCPDRYIGVEKLLDGAFIVEKMEQAIKDGYDKTCIDSVKKHTLKTIENIVRHEFDCTLKGKKK